ncbi:transcriptional regulator [Pasteurellaceae bacterium 15-036681]|nr:transcriptional regulator [Pasteurellaceae bacterium 15-036681]
MRISERLKLVCEHKNWKIKQFAELTGLPYRTMQGYIGGEREPNTEGMTAIAKVGVNLNWLVSGEGEIFTVSPNQLMLTPDEINLLEKYRLTTDSGKRILQATSQILCDETSNL